MSPENQNFGQVESGQQRLETVRASADSPQALQQKLQDYRATYQTEVNRQKTSLTNFAATFDSASAKDFVLESAGKLGGKMVELAQEGESLQRASIKNKQDKGEPLTEKELNFQTLASLKATLQNEMGRQRVELGNLRKLHQLDAEYSQTMKADNKANERVTVTGIPAAITAKAAQYETMARVIQDLSALPASPTYDQDRTTLIKQIGLFRSSLALDQQSGQTFLQVKEKATLAKADLKKLQTKISGKKPLTQEEYQTLNNELQQAFGNVGDTEAKSNEVMGRGSFLKNLDYDGFKATNLTPLWDNLLTLRGQLEAKNPQSKDTEKTEETTEEQESGKDLLLQAAEAREQLSVKKDQIQQVVKYLKNLKRDPKQYLNHEEFVKLGKDIAELQGEAEALQTKYQINTRAADKEPNTRLLFQRLQSNDYQPTLAAAQALMELNLARESAIKDLGNKLFNAEVEKLIPRLKESWATGIEGQKAYLETPPTYDEKDPNFKAYQEGERTLLTNLIACESQVNFVLSRQDSGLPEGNKLILERYRTLSQEYQTKIQSNRAHRHLLRAVREGQGQDQDHAHEVKVGTRERFDGENSFNEDITEQRRANYKFHECVRFLDPNDPKYQEINGGRGWEFIKQDLPKDIQDRFALNAAKIVTDSRHEAEAEMFRDKQKILTENKLFDRTKEDLGEQAKDYFAAGEAMAIGDIPKALAAYNKYLEISKTFSQEELDKHKHYLEDARRQVESVANSAEFYEAMHLMKDGQLDNALPKFRAYIERIKKLPKEEQKTFAEQLNAATEIMRKINSTKMSMLVELKNDLKYLSAIQTARNVGTKRDNIMAELKKLQQNSHALSRGEKPPFADADIDLDPVRRDLLLPYIPYDQLTTQEKIKINEGGGGLTGPDVTDLEDSIKKLEQRIEDGEPVDFEKEMTAIKEKMAGNADPKNYPLAATYTGPNGQQRVETPSARLFDMFDKINSTDPKEREKGFVYIADQFKSAEAGMQYTQKYLRKAMNYQYEQWEKDDGDKTQKEVMKKMLADKNVASDVLKGAKEYYRRYAEEENAKNPGQEAAVPLDPPDPIILQRFQSQIFEQQFRFQYEREVRKKMTNLGMASTDSALQRYNVSLPYETVDGAWYKPWNWSDCNEDQWNDVKSELAVFAVETIVTMPIGMGAGAIGRAVGSGVLKALARQGLKAEAIALIEKGGIMALRNSSHIWEGVSPALKQSIMASRGKIMASWGAGLAAEGTSMLLMNSIWEGLSTGRNPEIFRQLDAGEWKNVSLALLENIGKAGVFRAMGAAQGRLMTGMGAGVESSATRNMLAHVVGETASGSLGTGLEALVMLAKGQGAQITTEFWVRSLVQNSLQSYGTHVAHGGFKKPQFLIDREQARYKAIEKEMETQRLARLETQTTTDIQSPRLGDNASPYRTPAEITPSAPGVERRGAPKPPEVSTTESPSPNLQPAEAPTPRPALRPAPELPQSHLKPEEVSARVDRLQPDLQLLMDRESLDLHEAGPAEQTAADAKIAERAREMGLTPDEFRFRTVSEAKLLNSIGALDNSERQFYGESKIVKKPVLNEDGSPKLDANRQPVYENVNLFANYESKSSAYSRELLRGLSYEQLQAQGGGKVIKLGGDELLVFHAGPDGTVQKLFVDISNMGPTNDTATNIAGGKINLVDVYLHRVSEAILAQSKAQQGKLLDPAAFNAEVSRVADSLFNLDLGPDGQPLKTEEARARFEKLQKEWNLEGTFAEYFTDVRSMRILAEYRSDTRFLDSSYDPSSGVPFEVHIASEIQNISGLKVAELQQLIASNSKAFEAMVKDHLPKSPKIKAKTVEQLMEEISSIKPDSAKPEDLMMLYALMARADISQIAPNSPLRPLADRLSVSRTEMVGDPPHRRVMEPRLMDAKVVSIEIPPDLAKALSALAETDPIHAQAILAAARKMAEKPLDGLKYQTEPGFAEFRIGDHVAVRDGKIHIRDEGGEFGHEVKANENDKKLTNVIDAEDSLRIARSRLESLRQELLDGKIDKPAFDAEMVKAEAEISKLEEKILTDPDTLAFSQAYMDVTPTRMFSFDNGTINAQYRVWNSAVTELGHSGAINAKYGYAVMDQIMTAYHQQLQKGISAVLPPNLQHFKIIRSGGGKFEVIFLDSRAVAHLADQGLTPQSLVAKIAGDSGQAIVNRTLSADPAKLAAAKRDAAVRNSQFKYNKGTDMVELGQLSTRAETTIATSAITRVQKENPNASSRVMLGMARPPAATAPEASAQSRENTPPPSEGPPSIAIDSFSRYSERYNKEILVYKQGDLWIDQHGGIAPPPSPEEINIAVSQKPQVRPTAQPKVVPHIEIMSRVDSMVNNSASLEKIVAYIDQFNKASISDFPSGGIIQTSRYRISADNEGKLRMTIMFDSPRNRETVDAAVDRIVAGDAIDPVLGLDRPKPFERPIPATEAARLDQQTRDYILEELGGRDRFSDGSMYDFKPPIIESITPGQDLRKVYLSPSYEQMVPFLRELMGQVNEQGIGMRSAKFFSLAISRDGAGNIIGQGHAALCFYFAGDNNFIKFIEAVKTVEKQTGIKLLSFNNEEAPLVGKVHNNKILYGVDSTRPGDDGFTHGSLSQTMVERGRAARDAAIARGESSEQVRAATRTAMNEAVMQARGVGLENFLTLGENPTASSRPDAEWTIEIRQDLEAHANQLEKMGLTDCARELLDTNIKFSSVDGFALDTPQKRLAYYYHLADLAHTNPELLQWYQSRPRPFDSNAIAGEQGVVRQLAEQMAANNLKEFNSSFVSERIIPSLLDSPLKFSQQVQVLHEWLTRGTHAQTENMGRHRYNLGGAFREGVGVRVIVGDYRPPPPEQVNILLSKLAVKIEDFSNTLNDRKGKVPPEVFEKEVVQFAAFVMQNFSRLHPMADGNGRTARALYDLTISRFLGPDNRYRELPMEWDADGEVTVSLAIDDALHGRMTEVFPDRTSAESNAAKLADIFARTRYEDMLSDPDLQRFKTHMEDFMGERAAQVLAEGATESTTETSNLSPPPSRILPEMRISGFSDTPPRNLPADSPGWIDQQGQIFYNPKALNSALAPGYTITVSRPGQGIRMLTPDNRIIRLGEYRRSVKGTPHEGTIRALQDRMTEIKFHESMHRVNTLVENPSQFFAAPKGSEPLPQGKIRLTDADGQPLHITQNNVDEFISRVADGTQKITAADRRTLEQAIAANLAQRGIPNFTFARVRTVDTRLLATNPREAFRRAEAAAMSPSAAPMDGLISSIIGGQVPGGYIYGLDRSGAVLISDLNPSQLRLGERPRIIGTMRGENVAKIVRDYYLNKPYKGMYIVAVTNDGKVILSHVNPDQPGARALLDTDLRRVEIPLQQLQADFSNQREQMGNLPTPKIGQIVRIINSSGDSIYKNLSFTGYDPQTNEILIQGMVGDKRATKRFADMNELMRAMELTAQIERLPLDISLINKDGGMESGWHFRRADQDNGRVYVVHDDGRQHVLSDFEGLQSQIDMAEAQKLQNRQDTPELLRQLPQTFDILDANVLREGLKIGEIDYDHATGRIMTENGRVRMQKMPLRDLLAEIAHAEQWKQQSLQRQATATGYYEQLATGRSWSRQERQLPPSEVPRPRQVNMIGDLHGEYQAFHDNAVASGLINRTGEYTGGSQVFVFHGDILADRGSGSLPILEQLRILKERAKSAGGDIIILAGNHEDMSIAFLSGDKVAGTENSGFEFCLPNSQGHGVIEFIQKFSSRPGHENIRSLWEVPALYKTDADSLKALQQDVLTNMRKSREGRQILEQMCSFRLVEQINDTLFIHTELTPQIISMLDSRQSVSQAIDNINRIYQQGLRNLLLGEGEMPTDYTRVRDAFLHVDNREYNRQYRPGDLKSLNRKGINIVVNGHSNSRPENYGNMFPTDDGVTLMGVDHSYGKGGVDPSARYYSVGTIDTQGSLHNAPK